MKNKTKGLLLLILPIASLVLVLLAYPVAQFAMQAVDKDTPMPQTTTSPRDESFSISILDSTTATIGLPEDSLRLSATRTINSVLGLLGMIAVVAILIGVPFGIYFLTRKEETLTPEFLAKLQENPKYHSLTPEQITSINKWSWGAFFGNTIWAIGNKHFGMAVLSLIPVIGLYPWIKLSMEGRKLSWEKNNWKSFEHFEKIQRIIAWVIGGILVLSLIISFLQV